MGGRIWFYHRVPSTGSAQKGAYLNTGTGWQSASAFTPSQPLAVNGTKAMGARFVELNGDGRKDFVYHRTPASGSAQKNASLQYQYAPPADLPHQRPGGDHDPGLHPLDAVQQHATALSHPHGFLHHHERRQWQRGHDDVYLQGRLPSHWGAGISGLQLRQGDGSGWTLRGADHHEDLVSSGQRHGRGRE